MNIRPARLALVITLLVVAVSIGSYFVPFTQTAVETNARHSRMLITVAMSTSLCGAAILFFHGVYSFKAGLRVAYRWFAAGLLLFGLSMLQWPATVFLGPSSQWVTSGAIIVPFILATASMYVGMQQFARLLKVSTGLASWRVAVPIVAAATILSAIAAHQWSSHDALTVKAETDAYTALVAWTLAFGVLAWLIMVKIRRAIGPKYRQAMMWLVIALGGLVLSGLHEYITSYFLDESDAYVYLGLSSWLFLPTGALFLYAGNLFSAMGAGVVAKPASAEPDGSTTDHSYIDNVIAVAQLASRPNDVDVILDDLRTITSTTKADSKLSEKDRNRLIRIYRQLEDYLVSSDPLRSFTKDQLRQTISTDFRAAVEETERLR